MSSRAAPIAAALVGLLGVALIIFGEADDAPGLVLFGLLLIGGAIASALRPSLRRKPIVVGYVLAAVAVTAILSVAAGWLENNI